MFVKRDKSEKTGLQCETAVVSDQQHNFSLPVGRKAQRLLISRVFGPFVEMACLHMNVLDREQHLIEHTSDAAYEITITFVLWLHLYLYVLHGTHSHVRPTSSLLILRKKIFCFSTFQGRALRG